jgi:hypothetical protein
MNMFDVETVPVPIAKAPIPLSDIDHILTAQIVVAWAGEGGEERRLGWWRSDLVSEFGGEDLFKRLLPHTWEWAVLQGAREAARREDAEMRQRDHNPDRIISLYSLGFEMDERLDERFQELKLSRRSPTEALPGLADGIDAGWNRERFNDWLIGHGDAETTASSIGRRIKGEAPTSPDLLVRRLVAGLVPLADSYPLPHFRSEP